MGGWEATGGGRGKGGGRGVEQGGAGRWWWWTSHQSGAAEDRVDERAQVFLGLFLFLFHARPSYFCVRLHFHTSVSRTNVRFAPCFVTGLFTISSCRLAYSCAPSTRRRSQGTRPAVRAVRGSQTPPTAGPSLGQIASRLPHATRRIPLGRPRAPCSHNLLYNKHNAIKQYI